MHPKANEKAVATLAAMTLDEKIDLITGKNGMWTAGVPRLGIRALQMADASMGLRMDDIPATAFPATIALAASWNRELAAAYGQAVGKSFVPPASMFCSGRG